MTATLVRNRMMRNNRPAPEAPIMIFSVDLLGIYESRMAVRKEGRFEIVEFS